MSEYTDEEHESGLLAMEDRMSDIERLRERNERLVIRAAHAEARLEDIARDLARFERKRAHDRQMRQGKAQFGPGGPGLPPNPEPDKPTKMAVNE